MEPIRARRLSGKVCNNSDLFADDRLYFIGLRYSRVSVAVFSSVLLSFSIKKNTDALLDTSRKEGSINVLHGLRFFSMAWIILAHTFAYGVNYIGKPIFSK